MIKFTKILIFTMFFVTNVVFANVFTFKIPQAVNTSSQTSSSPSRAGALSRVAGISTSSAIEMKHDVKKMKGKKDYTHINIVLDASGSMSRFRDHVVESCQYFFEEQRKIEGEVTVTVWVFPFKDPKGARESNSLKNISSATNSRAKKASKKVGKQEISPYIDAGKIIDFVSLKSEISLDSYVARGNTPCYNAAVFTIKSLSKEITKLQSKRSNPERVIYILITDGNDNGNGATEADVAAEVAKHIDDWNFLLLGLGKGMASFGASIGLPYENCFDILVTDPQDSVLLWKAVNEFVKRSRTK